MALLSHYGSSDDMVILNHMQNLTRNPMVVLISSWDGFIEEFEGELDQKKQLLCVKKGSPGMTDKPVSSIIGLYYFTSAR